MPSVGAELPANVAGIGPFSKKALRPALQYLKDEYPALYRLERQRLRARNPRRTRRKGGGQ